MRNDILLTGDLEKAINDSGVYDRLIPFGFGKLMPIYSAGVETHVLIIAHSGTEREVGQHVRSLKVIIMLPLAIIGLLLLMVVDLIRMMQGKPTADEEWHEVYMSSNLNHGQGRKER